jgi:hypothetical protein
MSVYGGLRRNMKQIYGYGITVGGATQNDTCVCEPTIPEETILINFQQTLALMREVIGKFYPIIVVTAPGIGNIQLTARAPFVIIVRLKWVELYGMAGQNKVVFDTSSPIHRSQLKDIYLEHNRDWRTDPLFRV